MFTVMGSTERLSISFRTGRSSVCMVVTSPSLNLEANLKMWKRKRVSENNNKDSLENLPVCVCLPLSVCLSACTASSLNTPFDDVGIFLADHGACKAQGEVCLVIALIFSASLMRWSRRPLKLERTTTVCPIVQNAPRETAVCVKPMSQSCFGQTVFFSTCLIPAL